MKRKKHIAEQFPLPLDEPHQIVRCVKCGEAKKLEFRRSGDDELYYRCESCGFESEPAGSAPHWLKREVIESEPEGCGCDHPDHCWDCAAIRGGCPEDV